jgi:hypothetical protein
MNGSVTMVPRKIKEQTINKCKKNMCIMNTKSKRRSHSGNFDARITEFGVVVGKIRGFDVLRAIL